LLLLLQLHLKLNQLAFQPLDLRLEVGKRLERRDDNEPVQSGLLFIAKPRNLRNLDRSVYLDALIPLLALSSLC